VARERAIQAALCASLALVPGLHAAPRAAARPPDHRRGRVVRVNRPRRLAPEPVRLCMVTPADAKAEAKMVCYGATPPEPGSRFALIDDVGVRGVGTVRDSTRSGYDACQLGSAHDVVLALDEPPLPGSPSGMYMVAVEGVAIEKGSRILRDAQVRAPSRRDNDQVWTVIDRDGDGTADLLGTAYECSAEIRDLPAPPAGQRIWPLCIDYWVRDAVDWARVGRDVFYQCM
jgi:hypothetical protein